LNLDEAEKVHGFHSSFPIIKNAAEELKNTARALGARTRAIKDES
jgi:diaminopropionate ammonia-lyase